VKQKTERPAGTIRITASEHAAETVLWPALDRLTTAYPEIVVELNVENGLIDIVSDRFDAGIRLGEELSKDMIAVRIGPDMRMAVVATPDYFTRRGIPSVPEDLAQHNCINMRFESGGLYAWEFEKSGHEIKNRVEGQWILNSTSLITRTILAGHGVGMQLENSVLPVIEDGRLVRVLEDWCPPFTGYHLYYPSRRQPSLVFRLLIEALKYHP
jgi:DNA-binding transcriptional LysR family regulator